MVVRYIYGIYGMLNIITVWLIYGGTIYTWYTYIWYGKYNYGMVDIGWYVGRARCKERQLRIYIHICTISLRYMVNIWWYGICVYGKMIRRGTFLPERQIELSNK